MKGAYPGSAVARELNYAINQDFHSEQRSQVFLESGDILLILTDGFREPRNAHGESLTLIISIDDIALDNASESRSDP